MCPPMFRSLKLRSRNFSNRRAPMRTPMTLLAVFTFSCSGGTNGTNGYNGNNGQSVTSAPEPAGAHCAAGGVKLTSASGVDYVCNGLSGTNGTNADGGPGPVINCTPGETTCEGGKLWSCNKSGHDATVAGDCLDSCPSAPASCQGNDRVYCSGTGQAAYKQNCSAYSTSATNPAICATDHCASNWSDGVCCRSQFPQCKWAFTTPVAISGEDYASSCGTVSPCAGTPFSIYFSRATQTCPDRSYTARLTVDLDAVNPGDTVTLPNAAVTLDSYGNGVDCDTWTGTVTWVSDPPAWKMTLNTVCSETGESTHTVVGSLSGTL